MRIPRRLRLEALRRIPASDEVAFIAAGGGAKAAVSGRAGGKEVVGQGKRRGEAIIFHLHVAQIKIYDKNIRNQRPKNI